MEGFKTGDRIEMAVWTDTWMRGDRFAEVVRVGRKLLQVRFDRSGRYAKVHPSRVGLAAK